MKNTFFDGLLIYFVNLETDKNRLTKLLKSFKTYGIKDFKRIDSFDGRKKEVRFKQLDIQEKINNYQASVILSYINLLKDFLENEKSDYILMCDDDLDFYNSTKMNFNFYDTFEYHNPYFYNLKTSTVDVFEMQKNPTEVNKLIKPNNLKYGQSTIINKAWAEKFLSKYFLDKGGVLDLTAYTKNINNSREYWVQPTIDAINFDEYSYVWRVFSCFNSEKSSIVEDQEYTEIINWGTNNEVLKNLTEKKEIITIDTFIKNGIKK